MHRLSSYWEYAAQATHIRKNSTRSPDLLTNMIKLLDRYMQWMCCFGFYPYRMHMCVCVCIMCVLWMYYDYVSSQYYTFTVSRFWQNYTYVGNNITNLFILWVSNFGLAEPTCCLVIMVNWQLWILKITFFLMSQLEKTFLNTTIAGENINKICLVCDFFPPIWFNAKNIDVLCAKEYSLNYICYNWQPDTRVPRKQ